MNTSCVHILLAVNTILGVTDLFGVDNDEGLELFEKKIRPALATHCYECHSSKSKKLKAGLFLDRRAGWIQGGEGGQVIEPGKPEESRLLIALRYKNNDLRMPPNKQLPKHLVQAFEQWISLGAPDSRDQPLDIAHRPDRFRSKSLEEGRKFWAFMPLENPPVPEIKNLHWPKKDLDRFILSKLESEKLTPPVPADKATLLRRAHFDLTGLPPTPKQIDDFLDDESPNAFANVVNDLLTSPRFGERWGRHWLDVARYADTTGGGRNIQFPNAFRYREYVVESFNEDKPFDHFAKEQIAGDLLHASNDEESNVNLTGTGFLALGPHNYELQDKALLRMEVIDEQITAVGRGFLGLTMGCARCHDHPFDPIPTSEYYSLAGIFRSTESFKISNVANFIERELKDPNKAERDKHLTVQKKLESELKQAESKLKTVGGKVADSKTSAANHDPKKLEGIVVDDTGAKIVGNWISSVHTKGFVGVRYIHDDGKGKGEKSVTFPAIIPKSGKYEVQLSYTPGPNRSRNTPVTIYHDVGEEKVTIDQTKRPPVLGSFTSLGEFHFEEGEWDLVKIETQATSQVVIADAIRLLPVGQAKSPSVLTNKQKPKPDSTKTEESKKKKAERTRLQTLVADLKKRLASHKKKALAKTVKVMSVNERSDAADWRIHLRGGIRNYGPYVKRGFLAVATPEGLSAKPDLSKGSSGRLQLAEWVVSPENPLTARVYVNRVWRHLFGRGIVRTTDNFGEMGERPTHPALLDHLASSFIADGWSTKKLIRSIMLSQTYQAAAMDTPDALETDPDNLLFSRQNRRRLEVEAIRDAMLVASGHIDLSVENGFEKRSLFEKIDRNRIPEMFDVFDFPNPSLVSGNRNASTVPTQALFMMNNGFVLSEAKAAAIRILAVKSLDISQRIDLAYKSTLGRSPRADEKELAVAYLKEQTLEVNEQDAWSGLLHGLFACLDFRYLN